MLLGWFFLQFLLAFYYIFLLYQSCFPPFFHFSSLPFTLLCVVCIVLFRNEKSRRDCIMVSRQLMIAAHPTFIKMSLSLSKHFLHYMYWRQKKNTVCLRTDAPRFSCGIFLFSIHSTFLSYFAFRLNSANPQYKDQNLAPSAHRAS